MPEERPTPRAERCAVGFTGEGEGDSSSTSRADTRRTGAGAVGVWSCGCDVDAMVSEWRGGAVCALRWLTGWLVGMRGVSESRES